jgi:hypothetical protein
MARTGRAQSLAHPHRAAHRAERRRRPRGRCGRRVHAHQRRDPMNRRLVTAALAVAAVITAAPVAADPAPTPAPGPGLRAMRRRAGAARPEGQRLEPGGDVDLRSVRTRALRRFRRRRTNPTPTTNRPRPKPGRFYVRHVNGSSTSADRPGIYCGTNPSGTAHWWICASHSPTSTRNTARTR